MTTAGPTNSVVDVAGVRVGQVSRVGDGWRTGVTVLLPPDAGAVAGVDVRGAAPGTRETDLLDPRNMVERVHAVCLSGGSAFGLDAASGVMAALADRGVGLPVGRGTGEVVPIVPAAVLFDLGRGGRFRATPDAAMGAAACAAASTDAPEQGSVGAGTGASIGGLAGGIGTASAALPGGHVVAALVAANAAGGGVDPRTGLPWGARHGVDGEFDLPAPTPAQLDAWEPPPWPVPSLNTTLGVLVTDWGLTKAQCAKVAGAGQDGLSRAVHPAHTMVDGDTVFALALGDEAPDLAHFQLLLAAAADVVTRAIVHAMLAATGRDGAPAYRDLFPGDLFPGDR